MKTLTTEQIAKRVQFKWPINGALSQGFGRDSTSPSVLPWYQSMGLNGHNGLDIAAATGTPVYAPLRLKLTELQIDPTVGRGYGTHIKGESDEFSFQEGSWLGKFKLELVFGHLKEFSKPYKLGDIVEAGDIIALSDNTGLSTNPHLHFGVRPMYWVDVAGWVVDSANGYKGSIDPSPLINGFPLDLERIYRQYDGRLIKSIDSSKVYLLQDRQKRWFPSEEHLWSHDFILRGTGAEEIIKLAPFELNAIPESAPMDKGRYWDHDQRIGFEYKEKLKVV